MSQPDKTPSLHGLADLYQRNALQMDLHFNRLNSQWMDKQWLLERWNRPWDYSKPWWLQ